jgi:urea transporter
MINIVTEVFIIGISWFLLLLLTIHICRKSVFPEIFPNKVQNPSEKPSFEMRFFSSLAYGIGKIFLFAVILALFLVVDTIVLHLVLSSFVEPINWK